MKTVRVAATCCVAVATLVLSACGGGTSGSGGNGGSTTSTTSESATSTTSEPANDITSEPANDTTSEPANDITSEPANDTTSEPANDTINGNLATGCIRPIVSGPDASGDTTISAELDGDWPEDPEIHASVTFAGSTELQEFSGAGQSISVSDVSGDPVSTVVVWVTGANGFGARCRTWAVQP